MKSTRRPVALLLFTTLVADCGGAPPGLEKQWERLEAAQWSLETCLDTPYRNPRACTAEMATYDAALKEYRAAAPR
ncbi:MAG: hypothetical protein JO266_18260 [Acidobacteria bacterium]|nr:hypothetical protein [Acidobacteriota bacterium]MBV9964164.1 hypothetical protein [Alphaproteobacteria bacterium]